jgi:hypothetical protein
MIVYQPEFVASVSWSRRHLGTLSTRSEGTNRAANEEVSGLGYTIKSHFTKFFISNKELETHFKISVKFLHITIGLIFFIWLF